LIHPTATTKFTLADEARWNASHRTTAYSTGKKLRDMPIEFVSAGQLEGTIKKKPLPESVETDSESDSPAPSSPSTTQENADAMAHMALRSPSPALSVASTSSDEVVFQGRSQPSLAPVQSSPSFQAPGAPVVKTASASKPLGLTHAATSTITSINIRPVPLSADRHERELRVPTPQLTAASTDGHTSVADIDAQASIDVSLRLKVTPVPTPVEDDEGSDADSVVQDLFANRLCGKPAWEGTTTPWEHRSKLGIGWMAVEDRPDMNAFLRGEVDPRNAAMDDYMQNVQDFGLTDEMLGKSGSGFARREMGADTSSSQGWVSAPNSEGEGEQDNEVEARGSDDWDSDMLRDMDDMSTSSDVMDTIVRILSKRTRNHNLSYLCVYEGSVTDDARWLPATYLTSGPEKALIKAFEEKVYIRSLEESSDSGSTDEEDDTEDDEELDDETIARVLQKQEELGLGSDEVLLYAGDAYFGGGKGTKASFKGHHHQSRPNMKRQSQGRGRRVPTFPSASAMVDALDADPYGAFDIMDTERPSLKPKKKGRRGQAPPELEDPDLNDQLQQSWEADRAKKRLKKAEREELRQQGLLGRKGKAANLKVKYKGGADMDDVLSEIREFMVGDMQTLSLPPMEAYRRATIHQAATVFGLTSRSRGDGLNRFTVLAKTRRTMTYTDEQFDHEILRRGFLKRLQGDLTSNKARKSARASTFRSGNRVRPQTGYRDGEKVGEHAPELGPENKGHALMMKMGWSKGQALGFGDNQGILQPIAHTVKTNKAGLQ